MQENDLIAKNTIRKSSITVANTYADSLEMRRYQRVKTINR